MTVEMQLPRLTLQITIRLVNIQQSSSPRPKIAAESGEGQSGLGKPAKAPAKDLLFSIRKKED